MIKSICVCGAGTMGSGIAQVAAQSGFKTIQFDVKSDMLKKSEAQIKNDLLVKVAKERLTTAKMEAALSRLTFTDNIHECIADVIIEAIVEKEEAKVSLFNQLQAFNSSNTIFATNTSSISISKIATEVVYPTQVVGMHFFNPAPVMKLVEVVKGEQTSDEVVQIVVDLSKQFGKTAVICNDSPGFIVNRVARHYYLEAMKLVEDGLVDIGSLDNLMKATGFKMGPFELMDLIGLDINYNVSEIVWESLDKPDRLQPSIMQKHKVEKGELGRKTGKGFYKY